MNPAEIRRPSKGKHRRRWSRHSRRRMVALTAAALLLLVIAVMLHVRLTQGMPTDAPTEQRGLGQAAAPPTATTGLSDIQTAPLGNDELTWDRSCGVDLPSSPQYGPYEAEGQRRFGFARSASGAVVAAAHLLVQVSPQTGPAVFVPTLAQQVVGPDTQALTHEVHREYEQLIEALQLPYGQPTCPIYARLVGYTIDSYTEDAASLRLLVQGPDPAGSPQLVSLLVQLSWVNEDWRLVAPPLGDWSRMSNLLPASAATTFTPFGPGE